MIKQTVRNHSGKVMGVVERPLDPMPGSKKWVAETLRSIPGVEDISIKVDVGDLEIKLYVVSEGAYAAVMCEARAILDYTLPVNLNYKLTGLVKLIEVEMEAR